MVDVAKKANVSPATVSRVLRNPDIVKSETRQKVLAAIEELNYQPHMIASRLRTKESKTILVVIPDITRIFFSEVLRGMEHAAIKKGYQVILGDTENDVEREKEYVELLYRREADGMVLLTARMESAHLAQISGEFPIVLACEYVDDLDIPTVSIDNVSSAKKITEHLIKLGHTKIAHISGSQDVILSRDRLKGYKQALLDYNLEVDPTLISTGDFSIESGYDQMNKLLSIETCPTAVFVFNDEMALGAIKAVKDLSLRVPQDIAIVGFDNLQLASYFEPYLTTVDLPKYEIGQKAIELLVKQIQGEKLTKKKYVLKDELIIRESCGFHAEFYK